MTHPWVIARSKDALEILEAFEAAALLQQRRMPDEVVRELLADPRPYDEIAAAFGIGYQMVSQIKNRRAYATVPFEGVIPRGARDLLDVERARQIYLDPSDHRTASEKYGVTYATVMNIRNRRTHAALTKGLTPPQRRNAARTETPAEMEARHAAERATLSRVA